MIKYLWAEMLALGWARPRLVTVKGMLHKLIIQGAYVTKIIGVCVKS